jgi:ATP-dependent 26S proteasome regulatory subunit
MMVEKVPDSTYEMIGGLDKQIKEIKEVSTVLVYWSLIQSDLFIYLGHRAAHQASGTV